MSDDLVNQITLNFLISKSQLHKLNNKIKQKEAGGWQHIEVKVQLEVIKTTSHKINLSLKMAKNNSKLYEFVKNITDSCVWGFVTIKRF